MISVPAERYGVEQAVGRASIRRMKILWRACFVVAAICMGIGGPQHPGGETMADMLANPIWFSAHAWVFVSFVAMLAGFIVFGQVHVVSPRMRWWLRVAVVVTALEAIEMALHAVAYVDLQNLLAGQPTPVLTTHLALATIIYPIFGVLMGAFIVVAGRERALGSLWIAPLGVLGALAHGAAGLLVIGFGVAAASIGFPFIMLVMLWGLIAALMPVRLPAAASQTQSA